MPEKNERQAAPTKSLLSFILSSSSSLLNCSIRNLSSSSDGSFRLKFSLFGKLIFSSNVGAVIGNSISEKDFNPKNREIYTPYVCFPDRNEVDNDEKENSKTSGSKLFYHGCLQCQLIAYL